MKRAIDTNVLVYAHIASMPEHAQVHAFLEQQLQRKDVTIVLTPSILHEFLHVITDARRFEPPVTMSEALAVSRAYLGTSNVECLPINERAVRLAMDLLERHRLGRKRIADTLLTATLLSHGVAELITCNARDFEPFEGIHVIDPRQPESQHGTAM